MLRAIVLRRARLAPAIAAVLVLPFLAATTGAVAEEPQPRWEWGVGLGAAWLRDYPGSSHERAYALPYPWVTWRSNRVEIGRSGGRGVLVHERGMELDFTLTANPPSRSRDNPEREGMPTLDAVIEPGLLARWRYWLDDASRWRLDFRVPVRVAHSVNEQLHLAQVGVHTEPGIALERRLSPHWRWGVSTALGFADDSYLDYYYGVPAAYATAERPRWHADGGFAGWQAGTRLSRETEDFSGGLFLRVENVDSAVFADSPLVSTPWGWSVGLNLVWRLGHSRQMTSLEEP